MTTEAPDLSVRRLVVGVDVDDPVEDATVTDFLTEHQLRWWHWTRGMWLVLADDPGTTAETLGHALNKAPRLPKNGIFVFDVDNPRSFAGFVDAPDAAGRRAALRFLKEDWGRRLPDPTRPPAVTQ